jgi:hypothetical protein
MLRNAPGKLSAHQMFDGMPHWTVKLDVAAICLIQFQEQTESNIASLNTMCTTVGAGKGGSILRLGRRVLVSMSHYQFVFMPLYQTYMVS